MPGNPARFRRGFVDPGSIKLADQSYVDQKVASVARPAVQTVQSGSTGGGGGVGGEVYTPTEKAKLATIAAGADVTMDEMGWVSVKDYGAVGDGSTNDTSAIQAAIAACFPSGGLDRVILTDYGSGYTSAPTVSFTGHTGSGISATALIESNEVVDIVITAPGSGINVVGFLCGVTSGSATVTMTDTSDLSAGMSITGLQFPAGTTISSVDSSTQITASANATATSAFTALAFGIPQLSLSGGGGSGAEGSCLVGNGVVLYFPPGIYKIQDSGWFFGHHNLTILGYGATILHSGTNPSGLIFTQASMGIKVQGLTLRGTGVAWSPRDVGCGVRCYGSYIHFINVVAEDSNEFGFLVEGDGGGTILARGIRFDSCVARQSKGDGFHVTNGALDVQINDCLADGCGDDTFAAVSDYGTTNPPTQVSFNDCVSRRGGFRGMVMLGAKDSRISGGEIYECEGYGIEIATENSSTPERIRVLGVALRDIGLGAGAGGSFAARHGIYVTDLDTGTIQGCTIDNCGTTGADGISVEDVTDLHIGLNHITNSDNSDVPQVAGTNSGLTILYLDAGALKYLGSSGTTTTLGTA